MNVKIHFARFGKKESIYEEELLHDDGVRLDICSILPAALTGAWSKQVWKDLGIMAEGQVVRKVVKHHFYQQWFDVIELFDAGDQLLGYYCDVITPLRKVDGEYYLQDLLLDLWVFPDGRYQELDWDEFEAAGQHGLLTEEYRQKAVETLQWMVKATQQGSFPAAYLPDGEAGSGRKRM